MFEKKIIKGIIYAIFPVLFNVVFFMLGGIEHPASVWISYAWIHVAYFIVVITPLFSMKTKSVKIFTFTARQISISYFLIEFIIGLIFIFIKSERVKAAVIFQLIPLGLFLFVFLVNMLYSKHTADSEQRQSSEVAFIKCTASKVQTLTKYSSEAWLKRKIEKLYDLIHSSPSRSCPNAKQLESDVTALVNDLEKALDKNNIDEAGKLVDMIMRIMDKRNVIVALK